MKLKLTCYSKHCTGSQLLYFLSHLIFSNFVSAFEASGNSPCGNTELRATKGTITSPNYPSIYRSVVKCEWIIHSPSESILQINIVVLDIEEDYPCSRPPCCLTRGLLVPVNGGGESKILCGNVTEKTITVSQRETVIGYFSTNASRRGIGFKLTYDIITCKPDELHCSNGKCISRDSFCNAVDDCGDGSDELYCNDIVKTSSKYNLLTEKSQNPFDHLFACSEGMVHCPLSSERCYSPQTMTCNGVFDCTKGEDEIGCVPGCPDQIACSSGDGCYHPSQRCNFKRNCRDNSDETDCPAVPCVAMQFTCLNGACVSVSALCDGDDDCGDLSDEENCAKSSFMTAAVMGLLSCVFLFCIGLSCLYRVYTARLRASAGFAHQLESEPIDDEFIYREPPPSYSVAVGEAGLTPYPASDFMERYFESDQQSQVHRTRHLRHNRRRHRPSGSSDQIPTSRSRPRPLPTSNVSHFPDVQNQPKQNDFNKNEPEASRSNLDSVIELLGFPEEVPPQSQVQPQTGESRNFHSESLSSSPSLSPSRESVTSSTSLEDHEDLVRSCQS